MAEKTELSKLEKMALSEALVSYSGKINTADDLKKLINPLVSDVEKSNRIFIEYLDLYECYNTKAILNKGWEIIQKKIFPLYLPESNDLPFHFNFDAIKKGSEKSRFWKQCICLLSLWKFLYCGTRREGKESKINSLLDYYKTELPEYMVCRTNLEKIVHQGRLWLLDIAQKEYDWRLPPVYQENTKGNMAIQEQAMFLFTLSHLFYEKDNNGKWVKKDEIPIAPIQYLLDANNKDNWWWPDNTNSANPFDCSLRATCMALTTLSDLDEYYNMTAEIKQSIKDIGKHIVENIINTQNSNGTWPKYVSEKSPDGDIQSSGLALYLLDRFGGNFRQIPEQILYDSQIGLSNRITGIINKDANLTDDDIENLAQSLPALARSCPYLSVIWYRKAFKSLFEGQRQNTTNDLTITDVWQLYATIEIIRRNSIAEYLERII